MPDINYNNDNNAILVEHLTKKFRIPHERKYTLFDRLRGIIKRGQNSYDDFLALDDISFTVPHGETFGIIGANGSGKSTLLKIIAGILYGDNGFTHVKGKIAAFIELGVGFQYDLTAKDNIYLYGAIMGLSKRQITERYEEILTFSELKRFENMRLKNFSSGMIVRLAFSTAIQTDPDIMLVDEVLSVGDEYFQNKCKEKINELRMREKTIIFVSHSLQSVQELCGRCLLLDKGKIVQIGDTPEVIEKYHQLTKEHHQLTKEHISFSASELPALKNDKNNSEKTVSAAATTLHTEWYCMHGNSARVLFGYDVTYSVDGLTWTTRPPCNSVDVDMVCTYENDPKVFLPITSPGPGTIIRGYISIWLGSDVVLYKVSIYDGGGGEHAKELFSYQPNVKGGGYHDIFFDVNKAFDYAPVLVVETYVGAGMIQNSSATLLSGSLEVQYLA
jgi:lipopolysaccharide transport system ATP-binding protein